MARNVYKKESMGETYYTTDYPTIVFDDSPIGRMKRDVWTASEAEIDKILEEYGLPA